jgi:hypothetical protein
MLAIGAVGDDPGNDRVRARPGGSVETLQGLDVPELAVLPDSGEIGQGFQISGVPGFWASGTHDI